MSHLGLLLLFIFLILIFSYSISVSAYFLFLKDWYGVATMSRMLKNTGLFAEYRSLLCISFAKETYIFKHPTNRSHPMSWKQESKKTHLLCSRESCHIFEYIVPLCYIKEDGVPWFGGFWGTFNFLFLKTVIPHSKDLFCFE